MCECDNWARATNKALGAGYVPPLHHPNCGKYELLEYASIAYSGGNTCIVPFDGVEEFLRNETDGGSERDEFVVEKVMLTKDQYNNLPEFDGF